MLFGGHGRRGEAWEGIMPSKSWGPLHRGVFYLQQLTNKPTYPDLPSATLGVLEVLY